MLLKRKAKKLNSLVLTFDDGPGSRLTPAILDILAEHKVKATFFVLGRSIVGREEIVRQIADQGHEICSHGYEHLHYWKVSQLRTTKDIKQGSSAINSVLDTSDVNTYFAHLKESKTWSVFFACYRVGCP